MGLKSLPISSAKYDQLSCTVLNFKKGKKKKKGGECRRKKEESEAGEGGKNETDEDKVGHK